MADVAKISHSNIAQRVITAVVVTPIVLLVVVIGGLPFTLLVMFFALIGILEFYHLAQSRPYQGSALIGLPTMIAVVFCFYFGEPFFLLATLLLCACLTFLLETFRNGLNIRRTLVQVGMTLAGVFYLGFPSGFLAALRGLPDGVLWITLILCVTWGTDTFAYIGGRLWGKRPLAPKISPRKTREGALVGVVGGIVPALILLIATRHVWLAPLIFIVFGPLVAVLGDLLESALKRFFQVKDSHIDGLDLLPGHGGVLDRTDALLMVATFAYLVFMVVGLHS